MSIRTMFRSKTAIAKDIIQRLIRIVVALMADDAFSPTAPTIATHLKDKRTPDLVEAIAGCDSLLEQMKSPMTLMNPEVIRHCREALTSEVQRRDSVH